MAPDNKMKYTVQRINKQPDTDILDIFNRSKRRKICITNIIIDGKKQEICIDENGKISKIGITRDNNDIRDADLLIDGNGSVALPGLVNTHTHAAMTLLRGYADDLVFTEWLFQNILPIEALLTEDDVYWGTKLACLEMIRSGTTTFNDMYLYTGKIPRAVNEMGLRAQLSYGYTDIGGPDDEEHSQQMTEQLMQSVKKISNPLIKAAVGPHSVYTVSQKGLRWCADYAKEHDLGIHVHLSETQDEVANAVLQSGNRPARILDECGCLTQKTVAAHCCWLNKKECHLLGKRGTSAAHNPVSNMKLTTNRTMPYHWLKAAQTPVTLGTDGCASNNNLDMFEEMKFAALLQKYSWNNPTQLSAGEAFTMATETGAQALGFRTGKIAVGYDADIILIDPHVVSNQPVYNQISNIVYSLNGSVVTTVIVQGNVLMHNRMIPGEEEIIRMAQKVSGLLIKKSREK